MSVARVTWAHDCPMNGPCGYADGGTVWTPNETARRDHPTFSDWAIADALGLTADPAPDAERDHVMVAWDCRPGALECHYRDELVFS